MNSYGLSCHSRRGEPSVGMPGVRVRAEKTHLGEDKNTGSDRGVEDGGRRHQMGERVVGCCQYPWEDRCGLRLRISLAAIWKQPSHHPQGTGHLQASTAVCTHEATHSNLYERAAGVKQTNYAVMLQLNWRLEGHLKWIMNTIIFPSILDLPVQPLPQTQIQPLL